MTVITIAAEIIKVKEPEHISIILRVIDGVIMDINALSDLQM